ncbi:hypothetical protein WN51_09141 [Melipona quadrifasciata]|uniref:Circadian clock-controlled protein n=1 Tax=Melipona quadrifasciata TaxID=166423 RepID=A0A0M9AAR6_9HYME|nr:hypothetical protein WN51_09141 [Melipona quadrifasciata]
MVAARANSAQSKDKAVITLLRETLTVSNLSEGRRRFRPLGCATTRKKRRPPDPREGTHDGFYQSIKETRECGAYAGQGGQLCGFLEKFKETIRNGDEKLGIPVLDPLKREINDKSVHGLLVCSNRLEGYLKNVREKGLSDYAVTRGDFSIVGLIANVSLLFNQIDLMTEYNVNGTLMNKISLYGHGNIALVIKGLNVSVNLKLGVENQRIVVRDLVLNVHVQKFDLEMTGLFDDEDLSKTLSKAISEVLPDFIDDYQSEVSAKASPIVANLLSNLQEIKRYQVK